MNSDAFFEFEDILLRRRAQSDVAFMLKRYDPWQSGQKSNSHNHVIGTDVKILATGEDVKKKVLASAALDHTIRALKLQTGESEESLRKEAWNILKVMGHDQRISWARVVAAAVTSVIKRTFSSIYVNFEAFKQMRDLFDKGPVVFLPSHRSYMDFVLLSVVLYCYDMPVPVIAAAIDFLGMKFVGEVLRKCGAFYIRRSFKTDKLYWTIFYEYVQTHLHRAKFPIEFFIEGTRSRSGNFLSPKSGMLNVVCQDFFKGRVTDVYFVPVSISYERVLEENLYSFELATGLPKPKESTSGLFKALSVFKENFGNIYTYFGQPFSLRQAARGKVDRSVFSSTPIFEQYVSPETEAFVQELSIYAVHRIQENIFVQPWHLIASVLLNTAFSTQNRAVPVMKVVEQTNILAKLLDSVGARQLITSFSLTDILSSVSCHSNTVTYCNFTKTMLMTPETVFPTSNQSAPLIPVQLLMYQNMFINHLAPLCFAIQLINNRGSYLSKPYYDIELQWKSALALFNQEFVATETDFRAIILNLKNLGVVTTCKQSYDTHDNQTGSDSNIEERELKVCPDNVFTQHLIKIFLPYFSVLVLSVFILFNDLAVISKFDKIAQVSNYIRRTIRQHYDSGKLFGPCVVTTVSVNNVLNMCKIRSIMKTNPKLIFSQEKCALLVEEIQNTFLCKSLDFVLSRYKSKL